MTDPLELKNKAKLECYEYFDEHIRTLPRTPDGQIDEAQPMFGDNDVDAFRHAYVSGVFTHEYGETIATILGWMNEFFPLPSSTSNTNMDLWNNEIGRKLALKHKTRETLLEAVKNSLQSGQLIITPSDDRVYEGAVIPKPEGEHSVIVLKESKSGANEWFFDMASSRTMSREDFVYEIKTGKYPGYEIRKIGTTDYPASKRDGSDANNLG